MDDAAIKTYFKLTDLVKWLGLTQLEILINLFTLFVFSIILTVRLSGHLDQQTFDWFKVFLPLYMSDILNAYFCIIVSIRMYLSNKHRQALHRLLWSVKFLVLSAVFKYLLCLKLTGHTGLEYSEVFSPLFVLLQLIAVRACQFKQQS
jgi:ribonuclease P/MRP protein subunit RPP20